MDYCIRNTVYSYLNVFIMYVYFTAAIKFAL